MKGLPGSGIVVAVLILGLVEGLLHSEYFLYRLRSVFAVGRAFDKVLYVEAHPPTLLLIGNSRMDNGVDPMTLASAMGGSATAFNLGLPGANATTLLGIVERLERRGLFGPGKIERVVLGLDEDVVQSGDALGYQIYFVDPPLTLGALPEYFRSHLHLLGFANNLKQLREPAKLFQLFRALSISTEPIGGGAFERLGYRPGFGAAQDAQQIAQQEAGSTAPPDDRVVANLFAIVDLLDRRNVAFEVIYPPLLNRTVLYVDSIHPAAQPYREIGSELSRRNIRTYALDTSTKLFPHEFVNAGHLNDTGAQRFSSMIGTALIEGPGARLQRVRAP